MELHIEVRVIAMKADGTQEEHARTAVDTCRDNELFTAWELSSRVSLLGQKVVADFGDPNYQPANSSRAGSSEDVRSQT